MHSGELAGQQTHTLDESLLVDPEESDRPVVDFLGSTPGRMALVAVVLIAALLAVGVTASTTVTDRQGPAGDPAIAHRTVGRCRPTDLRRTVDRQHDRGDAFLSGGVEPHDVRDRYDAAIGQASAGLVTASNGVSPNDVRSLTLLTDLSNQLAVYTGMIATARANNRAGPPDRSRLPQRSVRADAAVHPAVRRTVVPDPGRCRHGVGTLRRPVARGHCGRRARAGLLVLAQAVLTGAVIVGSTPVWCWRRY